MTEEEARVTLRLPSRLRDQLVEESNASSRSMNGEIVARLAQSFEHENIITSLRQEMAELAGLSVSDTGSVQFRLPKPLVDVLEVSAQKNSVSLAGEIRNRLRETLAADDEKGAREQLIENILWLKSEVARVKDERDRAEATIRHNLMPEFEEVLKLALPAGLFARITRIAQDRDRPSIEEITQALEAAFPPPSRFSLDQFNDEWMVRIMNATEDREMLVEQANEILRKNGNQYEVWIGREQEGEVLGVVYFASKGVKDQSRANLRSSMVSPNTT